MQSEYIFGFYDLFIDVIQKKAMQSHRVAFYGEREGIVLDTASWHDPFIYLHILKRKLNQVWENIVEKEGFSFKIGLKDVILIRKLLHDLNGKISIIRERENEKYRIEFEFRDRALNLHVNDSCYEISYPDVVLMQEIIDHSFKEKIEYATSSEAMELNSEKELNEHMKDLKKSQEKKKILTDLPMEKENIVINRLSSELSNSKDELNFILESEQAVSQVCIENSSDSPNLEINEDISKWTQKLAENDGFLYLPGKIQVRREKSIQFDIRGKGKIWIPLSVLKEDKIQKENPGVWVKKWWLLKSLDKIGSPSI